ncbi:MAG: ATP-dependent Clp protease adaptor ClpS [Planctomycetota bacterium]|nr:ATP-dependent Clp protease adaptor ClpS [Planctomycetota bacterium]
MDELVATVVEPKRKRRSRPDKRVHRQPRYHVLLWDDDDHSYNYVIDMLQELFGYQVEQGFQLAEEVDNRGKAVVLTTTREHAELKRDQIHAYGHDPKGSMSASIEAER